MISSSKERNEHGGQSQLSTAKEFEMCKEKDLGGYSKCTLIMEIKGSNCGWSITLSNINLASTLL